MNKTVRICIAIILSVCVLAVGARLILGSQRSLELGYPDKPVGFLPIKNENGRVEVAPGLAFRLDTGTAISTITADDLRRIRELQCEVDSSFYPTIGKDRSGRWHFATKRYTVTIPLYHHVVVTDSLGKRSCVMDSTAIMNVIKNVDFIPAAEGEVSVWGIDILEKFILEYRNSPRTISLHYTRPDGYQAIGDLSVSHTLSNFLFNDSRYYIQLSVDHNENMYMIDTDMDHVALRLPVRDKRYSKRRLEIDTVMTAYGLSEVEVDMNAWVEFGNRAGGASAFFYDDPDDEYALNPFNFFMQDAMLDFRHNKVYLRPHVKLPKRAVNRSRKENPKIDVYED